MDKKLLSDVLYDRIHNVVMDINSGELSAKNGHYLIETILDTPPNQSILPDFYTAIEPKVDFLIIPPTIKYNYFTIAVFANKHFSRALDYTVKNGMYDRYRKVSRARMYNTVIHDNMNGDHDVYLGLFDILRHETFSYLDITTPHSAEMIEYYLAGIKSFVDDMKNDFRRLLYNHFVYMIQEAEDVNMRDDIYQLVETKYPDYNVDDLRIYRRSQLR